MSVFFFFFCEFWKILLVSMGKKKKKNDIFKNMCTYIRLNRTPYVDMNCNLCRHATHLRVHSLTHYGERERYDASRRVAF